LPDIVLDAPDDFAAWRDAARALIRAGVPPERASFRLATDPPPLLEAGPVPEPRLPPPRVPAAFAPLAERVAQHRDPERFALLYRLLWRLQAERGLLEIATDPDVARADAMAKGVRRDAHKLHAFLRFREVQDEEGSRFVAWFEPDHHILRTEAGFFVRRFAPMRWTILTPSLSAHWDTRALAFGPGARREELPPEDAAGALWLAYFATIFNPARLKPDAMRAEMPRKYWRNLPEAALIPELIREAPKRVAAMVAHGVTAPTPQPQRARLLEAESGAVVAESDLAACRACPLHRHATQPVPGEGPADARLIFVGEQPGDEEDLAGRPFIGPAGQLFDRACVEAGVDRAAAYVTNAVKHFKFTPRGRRRIHQKPDAGEVAHCRPFLRGELMRIAPRLVVALGATAAFALTGREVAVTRERGAVLEGLAGGRVFVTVHPAFLLRLPDAGARASEYARFVADLREAAALAA
jgi:uracil-DNA glycosylase